MSVVIGKLHRWVGLALLLPLLLEAGTGTILVAMPYVTAVRPSGGSASGSTDMERVVLAAAAASPERLVPMRVEPARWPGDSVAVFLAPRGQRHPSLRITVDPATMTVNGTSRAPAMQRTLHDLHARFLLLPFGAYATAAIGIFLFGLALTGVLLWWPRPDLWRSGRWRKTVVPARRARGLRLWRELHISFGFWCSLLLLFMSASGIVLAFPGARAWFGLPMQGRNVQTHDMQSRDAHRPRPTPGDAARRDPSPDLSGLDHALALLRRDHPDAELQAIQLAPHLSEDRFLVVLPAPGANFPSQMRLDQTKDTVVLVLDPANARLAPRLYRWLHTLHETRLVAPVSVAASWTLLVFVSGIALLVLSGSGATTWLWKQRIRKQRNAARSDETVNSYMLKHAPQIMQSA